MSHRFFLGIVRLTTAVSFLIMVAILVYLPPYVNSNSLGEPILINILVFELNLFLLLFASFSWLLFCSRRLRMEKPRENDLKNIAGVSTRQGFLLALSVLVLLVMQSFNVLIWWDGLLAVGAIIMVELYFLAR